MAQHERVVLLDDTGVSIGAALIESRTEDPLERCTRERFTQTPLPRELKNELVALTRYRMERES